MTENDITRLWMIKKRMDLFTKGCDQVNFTVKKDNQVIETGTTMTSCIHHHTWQTRGPAVNDQNQGYDVNPQWMVKVKVTTCIPVCISIYGDLHYDNHVNMTARDLLHLDHHNFRGYDPWSCDNLVPIRTYYTTYDDDISVSFY